MATMSSGRLGFIREFQGAWYFYYGHRQEPRDRISIPPSFPENGVLLLVGGFAATNRVYDPWVQWFEERTGLPIVCVDITHPLWGTNILSFEVCLDRMRRTIEQLERHGKKVVAIIGHSLGGVLAAAMLEELSDFLAFMVGSPIQGLPKGLLARAASRCLGFDVNNPPDKIREMRERLSLRYAHRMVVITSFFDRVAPRKYCLVENATWVHLGRKTARQFRESHRVTAHIDSFRHPAVPHIIVQHLRPSREKVRAWAA